MRYNLDGDEGLPYHTRLVSFVSQFEESHNNYNYQIGNNRDPPNPGAGTGALRRGKHQKPTSIIINDSLAALEPSSHTDMTKDPFASTASLDVNPFDDPFADQDSISKPSQQHSHELAASRVADLDRRELDLDRRERELHQKAETIRKQGRNNWPPCEYPLPFNHFRTAFMLISPVPRNAP